MPHMDADIVEQCGAPTRDNLSPAPDPSKVQWTRECLDGQIMSPAIVSSRLRFLFTDGDENVVVQFVRHNSASQRHRAHCRYTGCPVSLQSAYVTQTTPQASAGQLAILAVWRTQSCRSKAPRHRKALHSKSTQNSFRLFTPQHVLDHTVSHSIPSGSWSRRGVPAKQKATKRVAQATAQITRCFVFSTTSPQRRRRRSKSGTTECGHFNNRRSTEVVHFAGRSDIRVISVHSIFMRRHVAGA